MKRIILAIAGYAIYRWWNSGSNQTSRTPSAPTARPRPAPER